MPLSTELMGLGLPPALAQDLGVQVSTGLSGAGTSSQANATPLLTTTFAVFSTVAANSGALLPSAAGAGAVYVFNNGANALLVYPATGESINASSANTAFSVTNGKSAIFYPAGNRWMAILSA